MIANGIPVMTSRNGGAHELNNSVDFVFYDRDDLERKIEKIYHNRQLLLDYWDKSHSLTTMKMHIDSLKSIYLGQIL